MATLPIVPPAELRDRLGLGPDDATDEQLAGILSEAASIVAQQLPADDTDYSSELLVSDAIASVGCYLWDGRSRGLVDIDSDGSVASDLPAMSPTAGLVRKVRGLLLPLLPTGGLTV